MAVRVPCGKRALTLPPLMLFSFLDDDVIAGPGLVSGHAVHHRGTQYKLVLGYMPASIPMPRQHGQAPTVLYAQDYENMCRRYGNKNPRLF